MFTPEFFIYTFQETKRNLFKRLVSDPNLQRISDRYIDSQTQFAKMLLTNSIDIVKYNVDTITRCLFRPMEQASSAPYKVEPSPQVDKEAT